MKENQITNRRCYFLPFHSIFSPIFPKIEEWKEIAILKVLLPSTLILILEITISFHFDCYFLPFYRIAISFHFFWSINQSVNQQIYDLYIYKTNIFLITIQIYMQKGQIFVWAVPKMISFALLILLEL